MWHDWRYHEDEDEDEDEDNDEDGWPVYNLKSRIRVCDYRLFFRDVIYY